MHNTSGEQIGNELFPIRVIGQEMVASNVFVLSLLKTFVFIPGQVVSIALEPAGPNRVYSIASGMRQECIQILYNVKQDGMITPALAKLSKGDTVFMSLPFGSFYGKAGPGYWIASGTGIAPFISMFRSGLGKEKVLIHGSRYLEGFFFQDELKNDMNERYIRCCSGEKAEGVYNGRLTGYLMQLDMLPDDRKYYICGLVEMVVDTRELLLSKGVSYSNILSEIYF